MESSFGREERWGFGWDVAIVYGIQQLVYGTR